MYIISDIYVSDKVCESYIIKLYEDSQANDYVVDIIRNKSDDKVKLNIIDSLTYEEYSNISLKELLSLCNDNIRSVLGIVKTCDELIFYSVDKITWNLLDYVDYVKPSGVVSKDNNIFDKFELLDSFKIVSVSVNKYRTDEGIAYLLNIPYEMIMLDEYGIFWKRDGTTYIQLHHIYNMIYKLDMKLCNVIYVESRHHLWAFSINKKLVKFMTKVKVLGVDSLCW